MSSTLSDAAWEAIYAPYDQPTYQQVLKLIKPEDVVLEIGAGKLRLSRQVALIARKVYAVEMNAELLDQARISHNVWPTNLVPIRADARVFDFPSDMTVGVLMMRHCTHFSLYFGKLRRAGAERLITNARWHMSVEEIDLHAERKSFNEILMGWYACLCGMIGFKKGPVEHWSNELDGKINEVSDCPRCI